MVSVTVSVEVPLAAMVLGANALATVGVTVVTVRFAVAAAALLPLEVCSALAAIVLAYTPPRDAVTSTLSVQLPVGIERVAGKVTVEPPAAAATAPAPEHVVEAFGVAAITTPLGKVSVNAAARFAAEVLALLSVIVNVDTPLAAMVLGANALATVGVTVVTVRFAVAAAALLPFEVCSALAAIVLAYKPPRAAVTSTLTVQLPVGIERVAGRVTEPDPATAVGAPAPEHVVEAFGVAAITTPAGSVSVNAAVRFAAEVLALLSVIVNVDTPLAAMVLGANALATVGVTVVTVRFAVAAAALLPLEVCSALAAIVLV